MKGNVKRNPNNPPPSLFLISKKKLIILVNQKIENVISPLHVKSVVSILIEEMVKDLVAGIDIQVVNFGKIFLTPSKMRKYFDFHFKEVKETMSRRKIKFHLSFNFLKKLRTSLDYPAMDD